jgi:hypothetical protein
MDDYWVILPLAWGNITPPLFLGCKPYALGKKERIEINL